MKAKVFLFVASVIGALVMLPASKTAMAQDFWGYSTESDTTTVVEQQAPDTLYDSTYNQPDQNDYPTYTINNYYYGNADYGFWSAPRPHVFVSYGAGYFNPGWAYAYDPWFCGNWSPVYPAYGYDNDDWAYGYCNNWDGGYYGNYYGWSDPGYYYGSANVDPDNTNINTVRSSGATRGNVQRGGNIVDLPTQHNVTRGNATPSKIESIQMRNITGSTYALNTQSGAQSSVQANVARTSYVARAQTETNDVSLNAENPNISRRNSQNSQNSWNAPVQSPRRYSAPPQQTARASAPPATYSQPTHNSVSFNAPSRAPEPVHESPRPSESVASHSSGSQPVAHATR